MKDAIQDQIIEDFAVFDDWLDKYDYLIGLIAQRGIHLEASVLL